MRQAYKYSILLLLLSSCITFRNAPQKIAKVHEVNTAALAAACSLYYPAKPPVYIPGRIDTVIEVRAYIDTLSVACPPNLTDTLIVRVPGTAQVKTVTIRSTDTVEVDNTAFERYALQERIKAQDRDYAVQVSKYVDLKEGRNLWRIIALSACGLLAIIGVFKVKSLFTPTVRV